MKRALGELYASYDRSAANVGLIDRSKALSKLVTANGARSTPVQRWFYLKEAFSTDLLSAVLKEIRVGKPRQFLDPFCGGGTSLLACQHFAKTNRGTSISAFGIERNPFLHFVAQTKANWHTFSQRRFARLYRQILASRASRRHFDVPELSTLHRKDVFARSDLQRLLGYRAAIDAVEEGERDLLRLGFISAIESVSGVRKDGRALRIEPKKQRADVRTALAAAWKQIADDLLRAPALFSPIESEIVLGDGRRLYERDGGIADARFDLIMYSPPYLNNIDYTEVYKLELWLGGFVNNDDEFRSLRRSTLRSHPSIHFKSPVALRNDDRMKRVRRMLSGLLDALPKDSKHARGRTVFEAYFDDMLHALETQRAHLAHGGWIVCNVGNSLHGPRDRDGERVPVAADLLIAEIALALGLDVRPIRVARHLRRRCTTTRHLRESILLIRNNRGTT